MSKRSSGQRLKSYGPYAIIQTREGGQQVIGVFPNQERFNERKGDWETYDEYIDLGLHPSYEMAKETTAKFREDPQAAYVAYQEEVERAREEADAIQVANA